MQKGNISPYEKIEKDEKSSDVILTTDTLSQITVAVPLHSFPSLDFTLCNAISSLSTGTG